MRPLYGLPERVRRGNSLNGVVDMNGYPERPIFTKNRDSTGREYVVGYANTATNSTVTIGGRVVTLRGNPKVTWRRGNSTFGEELIIDFKVLGKVNDYPTVTPHESIEIYFPKDIGVAFLKECIAHIENSQSNMGW